MGFEPLIVRALQEIEVKPDSYPQNFYAFKKIVCMCDIKYWLYPQLLFEIFSSLMCLYLMKYLYKEGNVVVHFSVVSVVDELCNIIFMAVVNKH